VSAVKAVEYLLYFKMNAEESDFVLCIVFLGQPPGGTDKNHEEPESL
jgi:hypothetical protein